MTSSSSVTAPKVHLDDFYLVAREYPGQSGKMYGLYFGTQPATFGAKLQNTWYSALDFVRMVWRGLGDLLAGAVGMKDLSGPVGIVSMMSEVGKESATKAACVFQPCVFLGVHRREPCGHEYAAAAGTGRRARVLPARHVGARAAYPQKIDPKYEGYIHTAGLVLLLALMAYVMYNDISKLGHLSRGGFVRLGFFTASATLER